MFGFGKKKNNHDGIPDDLYDFLEEADKLYISAYETRSLGLLKEHFTRDCCRDISRAIVAEAQFRYFSDEKFRDTNWSMEEQSSMQAVVRKQCIYTNIKLSATRDMKVSDDYEEIWTIEITPDEYWISSVAGVS